MAEWNLSVRLSGQGAGLKRTLRDLAQDADRASGKVDGLRRDIVRLRAEASRDVRIRLDLDAGNLRRDVRAALSTAAGQSLSVDLHVADPMQLRREVQNAVRWAAWGHRIDIPIGLQDPMQLRRDVSDAVRWASMNQTIRVRVDPDTSALRRLRLPGGGSSGGGGLDVGLKGLLPLATAAIPLAAGLASNLSSLAGMFGAAGAGATAFGIALAGQTGALEDLGKAEEKYQKAVQEHGATSEQAAKAQLAYQQQLSTMPPETQKAAIALSRLKTSFGDWSDQMAGFTMQPVAKAFTLLEQLIPTLSPEVQTFSGELDRLLNVAGGTLTTPGFDNLRKTVADLTASKLDSFTDQVIHLLRILSGGQVGDGPLRQILDYARQNGPAAREALDAFGDAVGNIAKGAAEAGPTMLTLVTAAARLVAALPPELVTVLLQIATGLKLVQLASAGSTAAAAMVGRLTTRIQELMAVSAAAGGGVNGLRTALGSLSTGAKVGAAVTAVGALVLALHELSDNKPAVEVDKLSTSLNTLISTGKVTGALKTNFREISDSIAMVSKGASDNKLATWVSDFGTWVGIAKGPGISTAKKNVDAWDKSMADLVRAGHPKEAAAQFELLKRAWKTGGGDMTRLSKFTDDYQAALADQRFEQEMTAQSMGAFGREAQNTAAQLDAQKQSADGLRQALLALNDTTRSAYDTKIQFEAAVDDLSAAFAENGANLDINTEAGRKNGQAMSAAAKANDEMLSSGVAAGETLESMTKKSDSLRQSMLTLATRAFKGNKQAAEDYVNSLLGTPEQVKTVIQLERQDAIEGLKAVQDAIRATPNAKSVRVDTLNAAAIAALEAVGLKTKQLPDGQTEVFTANGQALGNIDAVEKALNNLNGKTANTYTNNYTTNTITTVRRTIAESNTSGRPMQGEGNLSKFADGGVAYAADGLFVPGYAPRRDVVPAILSPGEGVLVPEAVRKLGRATGLGGEGIVKALNLWGRNGTAMRFADGGVARFATGGFTYTPTGSADTLGVGTGMDRYSAALQRLTDAVNDFKNATTKAEKNKAQRAINAADAALGLRKGTWSTAFNLNSYQRFLAQATAANAAWEANLAKISSRAGADVAETLRGMGSEGTALVASLAKASTRQFNAIVANLRRLAPAAKATLADYTRQLQASTSVSKTFQNNLLKLASMGYGDLAAQLAGQGDESAMAIAASAVKDGKAAAAANAAAKANGGLMTSDDIANAVTVLTVLRGKRGAGIADVLAAGVDWPALKALLPKIGGQVKALPAANRDFFLKQMADQGVKAMARGGILTGPTLVLGGEAGVPESWIPQDGSPRSKKLLAQTAARMGYALLPAHAVSRTPVPVGTSSTQTVHNDNRSMPTVNLNGAHQSFAEQRADLLRHMTALA